MKVAAFGRSWRVPPSVLVVLAAVALVLSAFAALPVAGAHGGGAPAGPLARVDGTGASRPYSLAALQEAPLEAVEGGAAGEPSPGAQQAPGSPTTELPVLLTLGFANSSALATLVAQQGDPNATEYHQYLSAAEFTSRFSPNASAYGALVRYLVAAGARSLVSYPDRLAVSFDATSAALRAGFGVPVDRFSGDGSSYWAFEAPPTLPEPLAGLVSAVDGLGPASADRALPLASIGRPEVSSAGPGATPTGNPTYPTPVTVNGTQYVYPSDFQVAYDEEGLLEEYGAAPPSSVAALLWAGTYTSATPVTVCSTTLTEGRSLGPYDPLDLANDLSTTTPTGEPSATVVPVALGGPAPGCLASYDTTGVVAANTAELEAIAGTAPGASIYAVSTTGPSVVNLTAELDAVLSPPANLSASVRAGLSNVSVVSIDWGTADVNATAAWSSALTVAAARGITVAAAAGNSGDDRASSAWVGSRAEFPASDATASTGVLAVGGTSVELNPTTLHVSREVPWYIPTVDAKAGGPLGTAGGISFVYPEPSFQKSSSANTVLGGAGRGVPDVAAAANNTLVTLTVDGRQYRATNASSGAPFLAAQGTGISVGIVAGLLAVIDQALRGAGDPSLGYVDPTVYALGNEQYSLPSGTGLQVRVTGSYDYGLPTTPFRDVTSGSNAVYSARVGYDLVSGWGSVDAYNLTMYELTGPSSGVYGELNAVEDQVRVGPLHVTTTSSSGVVNPHYNASIQQNFFVANSLGAPVYWAQSVLYVHHQGTGWAINFTASLAYPFFALYPTQTVYAYEFPTAGGLYQLPLTFTLTTTLVPAKGSTPAELKFSYGVPGAVLLALSAPGASSIIGATNYTYDWQGTSYTDGPQGTTGDPSGFLAPQVVLVGAPTQGIAHFGAGTKGFVTGLVEPSGSSTFIAAHLGLVDGANAQSAESALGLAYTSGGTDTYDFAYSAGATTDGAYLVQPLWFPVHIHQTGLPATAIWYVNFTNGIAYHASGLSPWVNVSLPNGTYSWSASTNVRNWSSQPSSGSFTISGRRTVLTLAFGPAAGTVTFQARGPVKDGRLPFEWFVNLTDAPSYAGTAYVYNVSLPYGVYGYRFAAANKSYTPGRGPGTVTVSRAPQTIYVDFSLKTYLIEFVFQLPKSPPRITISMAGYSQSGSFSTWGLDEPNGTYSWSISNIPLGYAVSPTSGTVVVHGTVTPIPVHVTEPGWGPFGLGVLGYALVFGVPALAALWYFVRRSRRRRGLRRDLEKRPPARPPRPARRDRAPRPVPRSRPAPPAPTEHPPPHGPRLRPRYRRPDNL